MPIAAFKSATEGESRDRWCVGSVVSGMQDSRVPELTPCRHNIRSCNKDVMEWFKRQKQMKYMLFCYEGRQV